MLTPDGVFFITTRTVGRRFLINPTRRTTEIIGGILARALKLYRVELFCYSFVSNHLNLLGRGEPRQVSQLVGYLKSQITKRVGVEIDFGQTFWSRRYDASEVVDDESLVAMTKYTLAHGVKENLVFDAVEWPGVHAAAPMLGGHSPVHRWVNHTKRAALLRKAKGRKVPQSEYVESLPVRLTPLPCWEELSPAQRQEEVRGLLDEIRDEAIAERKAAGRDESDVLGEDGILAQSPFDSPKTSPTKGPKPACHAKDREGRASYMRRRAEYVEAYAVASLAFRQGMLMVEFPAHSFRPPLPPLAVAQAPP